MVGLARLLEHAQALRSGASEQWFPAVREPCRTRAATKGAISKQQSGPPIRPSLPFAGREAEAGQEGRRPSSWVFVPGIWITSRRFAWQYVSTYLFSAICIIAYTCIGMLCDLALCVQIGDRIFCEREPKRESAGLNGGRYRMKMNGSRQGLGVLLGFIL